MVCCAEVNQILVSCSVYFIGKFFTRPAHSINSPLFVGTYESVKYSNVYSGCPGSCRLQFFLPFQPEPVNVEIRNPRQNRSSELRLQKRLLREAKAKSDQPMRRSDTIS